MLLHRIMDCRSRAGAWRSAVALGRSGALVLVDIPVRPASAGGTTPASLARSPMAARCRHPRAQPRNRFHYSRDRAAKPRGPYDQPTLSYSWKTHKIVAFLRRPTAWPVPGNGVPPAGKCAARPSCAANCRACYVNTGLAPALRWSTVGPRTRRKKPFPGVCPGAESQGSAAARARFPEGGVAGHLTRGRSPGCPSGVHATGTRANNNGPEDCANE